MARKLSELIASADRDLLAIVADNRDAWPSIELQTHAELELMAGQRSGKLVMGYRYGIPLLDRMLGGLVPKEMTVLGGRPAQGKSSFVGQIIALHCPDGVPVHVFSYEMRAGQFLRRLWSIVSRVPFNRIRHPSRMSDDDLRRVSEAALAVSTWPLVIDDASSLTVDQLCARARISKRKQGTRIVAVDYLQKMRFSGKLNQRYLDVSSAAVAMAGLAKDEDLALLLLSSISEKNGCNRNDPPTLQDFRQSGDIQYEASTALLIHREIDDATEKPVQDGLLIVAKARSDENGCVNVWFPAPTEGALPPDFDGWDQPAQTDIATHPAGKITGIDQASGLPIVDRTQPSEVPLTAQGEDLPQQTAEAGKMSPEAEATSAEAAKSGGTFEGLEERSKAQRKADIAEAIGDRNDFELTRPQFEFRHPGSADDSGVESNLQHARVVEQAIKRGDLDPSSELGQSVINSNGAVRLNQFRDAQPVGATEPETGRVVTQPTDNLARAQQLATQAAPELKDKLGAITQDIPGASVAGVRESKDRERAIEKSKKQDQPPETISDLLAARISVDSPEAKDKAVAAIRQQFPVVKDEDHFAQGDPDYGYRSHDLQVKMANGSTAEVQIVPKDVLATEDQTHDNYERGREAEASGNPEEAEAAMAANRQIHDAAMARFNQRNAPLAIGDAKTNSPLETTLTNRVREQGPQLVAKYLAENTTDGVPYIGTDQAKSLFPEYRENPTAVNDHADQAATAISHAAWDTALAKPISGDKNFVRILTGSPASGKTTAVMEAPPVSRLGINRESIISDPTYGAQLVDQVLASGRVPLIHLVYTNNPKINLRRMIDRAKQIGRVVPIDLMAKTFVNVPKAIAALQQRYRDKIAVDSFDTSGARVVRHPGTAQPAVQATALWTEQSAREAMNAELERLRSQGQVPDAIYDAATRRSIGRGGAGADSAANAAGAQSGSTKEKGLQLANTLAKGARVQIRDGSLGTVQYVDAAMKIARVHTDDGRNVTARQEQLKVIQGNSAAAQAETPPSPALPGFEAAVGEQAEAQAEERGRRLTTELTQPKGNIEKAAGEMERKSPLFRESEANPQGSLEERHGGFGAINPANLLPKAVKGYLREQAELIRISRDIHGGLQDLDPQYDADVLRAIKLMDSLPGTPADQEQAYHHLENHHEPTTAVQREIVRKLEPMRVESEAIFRKLYPDRSIGGDYVHRIAQQKGSLLDRILSGSKTSGRGNVLKKNAAAGKKRSMMAIESPSTGKRQVVSVGRGRVTAWNHGIPTDIGALRSGMTNPDAILEKELEPLENEEKKLLAEQKTLNATPSRQAAARVRLQNIANRLKAIDQEKASVENNHLLQNLPGQIWRDNQKNQWKFTQATTKEIERHTPIAYYKNAAASTVTNWLELRKAERASDYLEKVKASPGFASIAVKPSHPGQIPDAWEGTKLPQLAGYYFEPHVAEVFDRFAKEMAQGEPGVFEKINSFLTTSIFLNPVAHIPNLTANWLAEKGLSPANILSHGTEFRTAVKAFNAVAHQNSDFLDALDAGAPLHAQRLLVQKFSESLIKKLQDQATNPSVLQKLQAALGSAVNVPRAMQAFVDVLSKPTWFLHDAFILQSAYAKMAQRGMGLQQAIKDTAEYIPDERMPTRVFNSKALADLLSSPVFMFSHYHYGVLKAWGNILLNFTGAKFEAEGTNAKGEPVNRAGRTKDEEMRHALNIAAGLALMLTVVYPEIDKLLQKVTHNKDARFRRAGLSTVGDNAIRVAKGDESPLQATRSIATPSVGLETTADLALNRDLLYNQRKIYNEHGTAKEIAQQVGTKVAGAVSPAQLAMRAMESGESTKKVLLSLIGVSFPRHGAVRLAAELRADHMPDNVETAQERKKSILASQARYLSWQGDLSGIAEAKHSGLFTPRQITDLYLASRQDPLKYEAKGLGFKDLLTLAEFRGTTAEERHKLLPLIQHKAGEIQKEPQPERNGLRQRMHAVIDAVHEGK